MRVAIRVPVGQPLPALADFIARCDWVVDLGPGGGVHGGDLLYSGPLETFARQGSSPTAAELRRFLHLAEPLAGESALVP